MNQFSSANVIFQGQDKMPMARPDELKIRCYLVTELSSKEIRAVQEGCDWLILNLALVNTSVA